MSKVKSFFVFSLVIIFGVVMASAENSQQTTFRVINPDFELSPSSGMTRKHWKEAALYLLKGAFSHVGSINDPMKFPKQPGKSYPQRESQVPTEKLEGLSRTLFVAAPLLHDNPDLTLNGIKVGDYYRRQLCALFNQGSENYIQHRAKNGGPHQNLVEFGAMAISMTFTPEVLWEPLTKSQKDSLASLMLSYADGPTINSNWKFFNIFILSFFKDKGYSVNEKLLVEYLDKSLDHYMGEGWYNDNPAYDYYSMWGFQMYGIIWSEYFGKKYYPEHAQKFISNFKPLKDNYPYMFDRDGKMIMWGRSISYRYAAATVFPLMGYENDSKINYGWMRHIASNTLLQFFQHPDFLKDNVPTLGFYGPYEPAVQIYSCRGSVYWSGKIFLGLFVPENNPFWTEKENKGDWDTKFKPDSVYHKFSPATNLLITNYPNSGVSEVRSWCNALEKTDWQKFRSSENYNKLSYSSAFPWQADGPNGEVSMNYNVKHEDGNWEALHLYTFKKFEDGIYYRDADLEYNKNIKFRLAEIPIANGIIRVDKIVYNPKDTLVKEIRFGGYSLPQLKAPIVSKVKTIGKKKYGIVNNGEYQLITVPVNSWGQLKIENTSELHPVSSRSATVNICKNFTDCKEEIFITLHLWEKCNIKSPKQTSKLKYSPKLSSLKEVAVSQKNDTVFLVFKEGSVKKVVFER